jgi:hypothetical protein
MTEQTHLGWFLTNTNLPDYITSCAQSALRGQTPAPLREYSFAFDEIAKRIALKAEVERELTENEREMLAVTETEIYSDFADCTLVETEVVVVPLGQPLRPLRGGVAYLREGERNL